MPQLTNLAKSKAVRNTAIGDGSFTPIAGPCAVETRDQLFRTAEAVIKAKPSGAKGTFVKKIAVTSTMGPGVKIEPASIGGA